MSNSHLQSLILAEPVVVSNESLPDGPETICRHYVVKLFHDGVQVEPQRQGKLGHCILL